VIRIRDATTADAAAIAGIYAPFVSGSPVTFENDPPGADTIRDRMTADGGLYPWLVATHESGDVIGYAYASRFRPRPAYRFAVETSVYLDPDFQGRGIGRALYERLLPLLEAQGFAQAVAAITLPNDPSVGLHEAVGFTPTGLYRRIGYKLGAWHDVGLWQRALAPLDDSPGEPHPPARGPIQSR